MHFIAPESSPFFPLSLSCSVCRDLELFKQLRKTCDPQELAAAFRPKSAATALVPLVLRSNPSTQLIAAVGCIRGRYKRIQQLHLDRAI